MNDAPRAVLYDYWRSSASYRVRIALNLKGLDYEQRSVALADGAQRADAYLEVNPQGLVPALVRDGRTLTQSLAICEYLDETCPEPPLLPPDPVGRARVRAMAQVVACDLHPLNNLRVLKYLRGPLAQDDAAVRAWYAHWVAAGLATLEEWLAGSPDTGACCHGDLPGLADLCLVPQVYNAERFDCDLGPYPVVRRIAAHCREMDAFRRAAPEAQPDAPGSV